MEVSLFFAGTAGSVPTARRGLPAIVLRAGGERILFDCGEGTQQQLMRSIGLPELDAIFVTHLHLDHWLGLVGMLKTFDLRARERPLTVHGPPGLGKLFSHLAPLIGRLGYELAVVELDRHEEVPVASGIVEAFQVNHRGGDAYGYLWRERDRPGEFDPQAATALGIEFGPDFGRLQRGEVVDGVRPEQVVGAPRRGRRIVISGDTQPHFMTEEAARGAQVLVHEATFLDADARRAEDTGHSTALQAAEIARDADVDLLALVHISTRYFPAEIRDEARSVFPDTVIPRDFQAIEVPFPERGEPQLVDSDAVEPEETPQGSDVLR